MTEFTKALAEIQRGDPSCESLAVLLQPGKHCTELICAARRVKNKKIVSYSRNVFLPITNLCRNRCEYCGFRRDPPEGWLMSPSEVKKWLKLAREAKCSESLFSLGEKADTIPVVREKLNSLGYPGMGDYLEYLCELSVELGVLPHTNAGILELGELRRLKQHNASMGLMLETTAKIPAHRKSPGKDPKTRIHFIEEAGKLHIPFTTGLLVGVGETCEDRARSLLEIKKLHERYSHIQEIIIQPFVPQPNTPMEKHPKPEVAELLALVAVTRLLMPEMNIQVPPNLLEDGNSTRAQLIKKFLIAGANDLGGISPLTPDFINPEHPWPKLKELYTEIKEAGFIPRERLPIYPEYIKKGFMSDGIAELVTKLAGGDGFKR